MGSRRSARAQIELLGQQGDRVHARAVARGRLLEAEGHKVDFMAEPAGNHREARMPAFGRFGLAHQREMTKPGQHAVLAWNQR
jgi:hypothetical protein